MPGKLDHASVVAYRVCNKWPSLEAEFEQTNGELFGRNVEVELDNELVENGKEENEMKNGKIFGN